MTTTYYTLTRVGEDRWEVQILLPDEERTFKLYGQGGTSEAKLRLDEVREGNYEQIAVDDLPGLLAGRVKADLHRPVLTLFTPEGKEDPSYGSWEQWAIWERNRLYDDVWKWLGVRPEILCEETGKLVLLLNCDRFRVRTDTGQERYALLRDRYPLGFSHGYLDQREVEIERERVLQKRWNLLRRKPDPGRWFHEPYITSLNGVRWELDCNRHYLIRGNEYVWDAGYKGYNLYTFLAHGRWTCDVRRPAYHVSSGDRWVLEEENEINPVW